MGTRRKPRIDRLEGPSEGVIGLEELIGYIEEDIPEIMRSAAAIAKEGNGQVLSALISMFAKYVDQKASKETGQVLEQIRALQKASLERIRAENPNQES